MFLIILGKLGSKDHGAPRGNQMNALFDEVSRWKEMLKDTSIKGFNNDPNLKKVDMHNKI